MAAKTFTYRIDIESSATTKDLAQLELQLNEVNKAIREAKKAGDTDTYESLRREQLSLQDASKELRKEIRAQQKDFRDQKFPEDSIIGLRTEYRKLTKEIRQLSQTDPDFDKKSQEALNLKNQIRDLSKAFGDTSPNVGNYQEAIENALGSTQSLLGGDLTSLVAGFGAGGAVVAGLDLLQQAAGAVRDLVVEFSTLRGEIERITNLTGDELNQAATGVQALAQTFDKDVNDLIIAANSAAQGFGITFEEALDGIRVGLIAGNDINGQFLDTLQEYPTVIDNAGLSFEEFIKLSNQQAEGGFFNDKLIDTVKEFDLAVKELTKSQLDALAPLGEDFVTDFTRQIEEGSLSTRDALFAIAEQAKETGLNIRETQTITADLFRGAGEDAGGFEKIISAVFAALETDYDSLSQNLNELQQRQQRAFEAQTDFAEATSRLTDELEPLIGNFDTLGIRIQTLLIDFVIPLIQSFKDIIAVFDPVREAFREYAEVLNLSSISTDDFFETLVKLNPTLVTVKLAAQGFALVLEAIIRANTAIVSTGKSVLQFFGILADEQERGAQAQKVNKDVAENFLGILQEQAAAQSEVNEETKQGTEENEKAGSSADRLAEKIKSLGEKTKEVAKTGVALLKSQVALLRAELESAPDTDSYAEYYRQLLRKEEELQAAVQAREAATALLRGQTTTQEGQLLFSSNIDDVAQTDLEIDAISEDVDINQQLETFEQVQNGITSIQEREAQKRLEIQKKEFEQQRELTEETGEKLGELVGDFASGQIETFDEFGKQVLQLGLDLLEKQILLSIASAQTQSLAQPDSVATFGASGLARAAVLTGLIKGAFAVVKGAIQSFAEGGQVAPDYSNTGVIPNRQNTKRRKNGDRVLAYLTPGEVVLNKSQQQRAVRMYGTDIFAQLGIPGFADGGIVPNTPQLINPVTVQSGSVSLNANDLQTQAALIAQQTAAATQEAIRNGIAEAEQRRERREELERSRRF